MLVVALVSAGGFQGSTLIDALVGAPDLEVLALDCFEDNINRHLVDGFHLVPLLDAEEEFLSALEKIVVKNEVGLIIPSTAHELPLLARHRQRLAERGAQTAVSPPELLELVSHKGRMNEALSAAGCPTLPAVDLTEPSLNFPLFGKPTMGWGGRGQRLIRSAEELDDLDLEALSDEYLWQPFLEEFVELSIDFAIDLEGEVSPLVLRKRLRTALGFAVVTESAHDEEIEEHASGFASWLAARGGCGLYNVQAVRTPDGAIAFTDVNPRVGTSSIFSLGIGVNLPRYVCRTLAPRAYSPPPSAPLPVRMIRRLAQTWVPRLGDREIAGIVFDLDDTLLDQKRWMAEKLLGTCEQLAEKIEDPTSFLDAGLQLIEEGPRDRLLEVLIDRVGLPENLLDALIKTWRFVRPSRAPLFRDVDRALDELRAAGLRIGILTDNPIASQQQKLSVFPAVERFDGIVFSREAGAEKPAAVGFEAAAESLGVPPAALAMVGDNPYRDGLGAIKAGYGHAFWLTRPGTFCSFHPELFEQRYPEISLIRIDSLDVLLEGFRKAGQE